MIYNTIGLEWVFSVSAVLGIFVLIFLILGALALIGGIVYAIISTVIRYKKSKNMEGNKQWFIIHSV